ncbi:uncharacterized protein LOC101448760 [Ceratitis capitata]|uniref:ascorbate ferrireductase (transmembrane) n=1 Tax=Ceratitis capitata TaxID=7213 RepID=A0A811UJX3_CERCA|nr:uncharacterized protein LOC101448760 [Ceratitis capitata]CAD6997453.1 unnamed protein product [Ceratitis capitata]
MVAVDSKEISIWANILQRIEIFLWVLNQACIGFVTIYMFWACISRGMGTMQLHAFLVTLGFSLLMAEGIMCHYSINPLTNGFRRKSKTTIHWILLTLGGGCGVAGCLIMIVIVKFKMDQTHNRLGFAAFILCLISMLSGLLALFSKNLRRILSPLFNKGFHNLVGFGTFVTALVAQFYGYEFFHHSLSWSFINVLQVVTLVSLVLTSIGPLKALYQKISSYFE